MSSASIAGQISQCDGEISAKRAEIDTLQKEISDLQLLLTKLGKTLNTMDDEYAARKRRMDNMDRLSDRAKIARIYLEGMTTSASTFREKLLALDEQVQNVQTELARRTRALQEANTALSSLESQLSSLQTQYNQAVWDEQMAAEAAAAEAAAAEAAAAAAAAANNNLK